MHYRKEIDGLRALAVIPVVFFHAGFSAFSGGFVGVDVFFVISGYLITSLIISELQAGTFSIVRFYERRARRILPALFIVAVTSIIFAWFLLLPTDLKDFSQSLVAVSTFLSNYLFYLRAGYFDSASELKPLLHTWSLSVEEQYYLIYPLFLFSIWRCGSRAMITSFVSIALLSLMLSQWHTAHNPNAGFYLLPSRAFELLIGAIISWYLIERQNKLAKIHSLALRQVGSIFGVVLIVIAIITLDNKLPFPGFLALIPTLGAACIIICATQGTMIHKILASKIFVGIGLISYGTYLWHQPLFAFARHISIAEPSSYIFILLSLLSIAIAFITWRYVETPFRKIGNFSRFQIFTFSSSGCLVLLGIGLLGHYTNGFPDRHSPSYLPFDYLSYAAQVTKTKKGLEGAACITEVAKLCQLTNYSNPSKKILLVGDSHSADYTLVYHEYALKFNANAWQMSIGGCAFLKSQESRNNGECGRALALLKDSAESKLFDEIILIGAYYSHTSTLDDESRRLDIKDFVHSVDIISANSKLIVFLPRDDLSFAPMKAAFLNKLKQVVVSKTNPANDEDWVETFNRLVSERKISIFDEAVSLRKHGCGQVSCFNGHTLADLPLYRDTNHLTDYGAKLVFDDFITGVGGFGANGDRRVIK